MRLPFYLLVPLVILAGCGKRDLPTIAALEEVSLEEVLLPELLGSNQIYRLEIKASGEVDSIRMDAVPQGMSSVEKIYYLYDDGGAKHPYDGDIIAFDGLFTQSILWQPVSLTSAEYLLRFQAMRSGQSVGDALELMRRSGDLRAPVIQKIILPDTLASGFSGTQLLQAIVVDSSGPGDVTRVEVAGSAAGKASFDTLLYDDGTHGDVTADDGLFTLAVDRTFGARKNGVYTMNFVAVDKAGQKSPVQTSLMAILNSAPVLFDLDGPATVTRPVSGNSFYLVSVHVEDPQGAQDINRVLLRAYNPDGSGFNNNPFIMYDNGLELDISRWDLGYRGDLAARDGI